MNKRKSKGVPRAVIYGRVSTKDQDTSNQLQQLREVAERKGWEVVHEYVDEGISGAKGRKDRPEFDRLCKGVVRSEFDVVLSWSVDRLGRSMQALGEFLSEIHAQGVDLYLHQQAVDTTTIGGKALFQMCGVFAEFERGMIRERVNAGLARARAEGKTLGRPRLEAEKKKAIRAARRAKGRPSIKKIAAQLGVSVGVVHKVLHEGARRAA